MQELAPQTLLIDVEFSGEPRCIACYGLVGDAGIALVDPGPSSSLSTLTTRLRLAGFEAGDLRAILLTHIHLDHAGATGNLIRRSPDAIVYVHERGAPHIVEPGRLIASATRLYGHRMQELWGEILPVPTANVRSLRGGERFDCCGTRLEVAYTPGHASHHVSYFDATRGTVFVGDTAGIRIDNRSYVMPVTPPPDIDLEAWSKSRQRIANWNPDRLCLTHFGAAHPVQEHLEQHAARLEEWSRAVQQSLAAQPDPGSDDASATEFDHSIQRQLRDQLGAEVAAAYLGLGGPEDSWKGLARYWRKRQPEPTGDAPRPAAGPLGG